MKNNIHNIISGVILCIGIAGCATDDPKNIADQGQGYSFDADIAGYGEVGTRATRIDTEDLWTWKSFTKGDKIGFYSLYGNSDAPGGNGSFNNVPMTYGAAQSSTRSTFYNNEIDFNTDNFVERKAFFYFPYVKNIDYDPGHTKYIDDNYGFEIRKIAENEDEIDKCNDLLWIFAPSTVTGNMSFSHAFSEIMILRGEGFKDAKDRKVKIVLDKGFSHAVVDDDPGNYLKYFRLVYLEEYKKTEEECRVWYAWEGKGDYKVEDRDNREPYPSGYNGVTFEEKDIHYVILPTHRILTKPSVDYIEICDDDGRWHKVSNFVLYNQTKTLERGQRYPLVIKIEEKEVIVQPIAIEPWEDTKLIEDNREAGINSATDLRDWLLIYKEYLSKGRPRDNEVGTTYENQLKNFGDMTVPSDNSDNKEVKWTFYINTDIDDLSNILVDNQQYLIARLDDTLDGLNNTIRGLSLSAPYAPSFIGEIGEKGKVVNLNFTGLNLQCTGSDDSPAGGITTVCKGKIENCSIDGAISTTGPVGIIAGEAFAGSSITSNTGSGLVIGSETVENGLVGKKAQDAEIKNNNTAALIYQSIKSIN